ncbi:hypothetical protein [Vibrio kanaloae]|jgi:hypothetical protein|uniref:Uncharacterized protein n=1 Tax=Vibrio kanaloae TaxID=170673 RepID=A0A4U1XWB6_9VIBR|nr:hypothetical protein [Vibrio kanaloae]KAB0458302.1 hypothetical protein F7Q89_20090 [Vibrio kanaloae]MCG9558914.1 hypothetical protein [Vibrio kanaloae]NOI03314.1 hypothetical protein [Vibrio kanaloae]QPK06361.1 hypothetical protein BTD91_14430 [Vibrio kanaloae]TKE95938.1 hypothetical protein FCV44_12730 [Vibrio kanaloae]
MYRYVSSPQASKYIVPPPLHRELSSVDVPESELEMREILNNWFADGLAPIIQSDDHYISKSDQIRFEKLSHTVGVLLRNRDYYFAAKRILSVWDQESIETTYVNYLLLRGERVLYEEHIL